MAEDLAMMRHIFVPALSRLNSTAAAVADWRAVGEWLSKAATNCWMPLEDRQDEIRVRVGLFSGIQDTNGCNERRHVIEVERAMCQLEEMGLWKRDTRASVHMKQCFAETCGLPAKGCTYKRT